MKLKIYKARVALILYVNKILSKILIVDTTPLFGVAGIIERDGKILFVDHSYFDGIGLPGGVVKAGESLEEALKREILEETGLTVTNMEYFGSYSSILKGVPTASAVFMVKADGKEEKSDEGGLVWLSPKDSIGKFTYADNEKAIKEYLKKRA